MIALNHSFLGDIAHAEPRRAVEALAFVEHVRRRTRELPRVHETLSEFETGAGPLIQWANRSRGNGELRPLVELVLRMVSGPFLPEERFEGPIDPPLDALDGWLVEVIRRLLAAPGDTLPSGLVSPAPTGGAEPPDYRSVERAVSNWRETSTFDRDLAANSQGSTLAVLLAVEQQMGGQLIVLPSAKRSAETWTLDCGAPELHRALVGFEVYVAALREGLHRDACAERYHHRTTIPMSGETAAVWRDPTKRQRRSFVAGIHGEQYFDMHAKPGNLTRVHIWTPPVDSSLAETPIYVGYCGRHI